MLILARYAGQVITIGNDICVTVISIKPGEVKLGISAPDDVEITRPNAFFPKPVRPPKHIEHVDLGDLN